jgi:hypothetical protein
VGRIEEGGGGRFTDFLRLRREIVYEDMVVRECILEESESVFGVRPGAVSDRVIESD